jgi:hypothetical protein
VAGVGVAGVGVAGVGVAGVGVAGVGVAGVGVAGVGVAGVGVVKMYARTPAITAIMTITAITTAWIFVIAFLDKDITGLTFIF